MIGDCPYCGGMWSNEPGSLTFYACCEEMAFHLASGRDEEADRRMEAARDRRAEIESFLDEAEKDTK